MKRFFFYSILLLLSSINTFAQQNPQYTQYMYNLNVVNPAYAGSQKDIISFGLIARKQWINISGAPSTYSFAVHGEAGKQVGLGLSVISDQIGPVTENNFYGDVSYTLDFGEESHLAFGVKAGVTSNRVGLYDKIYNFVPQQDVNFAENTSRMFFNFGAGIFYYTDHFYISASVPNLIRNYYLDYDGIKYGTQQSHYFLSSGYVFDISTDIKLKPFVMVKSAFSQSPSIDISLNSMLYDKVELGITHRLKESFGALINFSITPSLRIGYAYDRHITDFKVVSPSSHEFILLYNLGKYRRTNKCPRFF